MQAVIASLMDYPVVECIIQNGEPIWHVECQGRTFSHRDRWQAEVVAHAWAVRSSNPPTIGDEPGGRFGEPGT